MDEDEESLVAPRGPRVPPGIYQVEAGVDGKSFVKPLTVKMDPRSSASAALLSKQFRFGKEIFEETLKSRGALAEIDSVKAHLTDLKPELLKQSSPLSAQLIDLEERMGAILEGDRESSSDIRGLESANSGIDDVLNSVESGNRETPEAVLTLLSVINPRGREADCFVD